MLARDCFAEKFHKQYKATGVTARPYAPGVVPLMMPNGKELRIGVEYDSDESGCTYSVDSSSFDLPAGSAWRTHIFDDAINFAARDLGLPAPERAVV